MNSFQMSSVCPQILPQRNFGRYQKSLIHSERTNRLLDVKYFVTQHVRKSFTYSAPRYWNKLNFEIIFTENAGAFKSLVKNALLENENNILSATTGYYFLPRY